MQKLFVVNGIQYSEAELEKCHSAWLEIAQRAVCSLRKTKLVIGQPDHLAIDVTHKVMEKFLQGQFCLDPAKNGNGYIYRSAKNQASNDIRDWQKQGAVEVQDCYHEGDRQLSPAERMAWADRAVAIEAGFRMLEAYMAENGRVADPHRECLALKMYLEGASNREIQKRFKFESATHAGSLKNRYLPLLQMFIRKAAA